MDIKIFKNGGMDLDSAPQDIEPNDYIEAYNIDNGGISDNEEGDVTDIEANSLISFNLPAGINKTIGKGEFPSIRKIIDFTYNSSGKHTINEYDADTETRTKLFENLTDSDGIDVLPLTPEVYVKDVKLIEDTQLFFLPSSRIPSIFNLERLRSGGYGTIKPTDFHLVKAQPSKPINPIYGDDAGASSNQIAGKLMQFRYQYIYLDNEPSAWSTISKRPVPSGIQTNQTDVTKDNNLLLNVDISDDRVKEIRIAALINSDTVWQEIRNVKRSYIISLTDTAVDPDNDVYEAYNPATNEFFFLFYNNGAYQPINELETDLGYDYVPLKSEAAEVANGNVLLLAGNTEGYDMITPDVDINVSYEGSGLEVINTDANAIRVDSFENRGVIRDFRSLLRVYYSGVVRTGDRLTIRTRHSQTGEITTFDYIVQADEDGDTETALNRFAVLNFNLGFNVFPNGTDKWILQFVSRTRHRPLDATVIVADTSSGNFNSKRDIKLNSTYQLGLQYYDLQGRYFPLLTGEEFEVETLHYGATQGSVPSIDWVINHEPPEEATSYQWVITKNLTHLNWLYINGTLLQDQGGWDASANSPTLASETGTISHFYTVTKGGSQDLGNGLVDYGVGDYIIYNGLTYDRIPYVSNRENGSVLNIGDSSNFLTIYAGSLNRFNKNNASSVLNYDYSVGDRVTIHSYTTGGTTTYLSNPAIDVEVVGYDPTLNVLRIRKPANLVTADILGKELLLEIYTPKKTSTNTEDNVFFEIGEAFTITNGVHDTLSGSIKEADSFIKTREYLNALDYTETDTYLVEDPNYSDFYISNYYSYGRPHLYNSLAKQVVKKADVRYSDVINTNNNINLLNRFYAERVETYDYTKGAIKFLVQRGNIVVCLQELEYCYIPIEQSIIEDQVSQENVAISDRLLNKARYPENNQAGIGNAVESFAYYKGNIYFVDPFRSEPCRIGYNGLTYIRGKLSKFFKRTIQEAYRAGKKHIGWIDVFKEDYILSVEYSSDIVKQITFSFENWITQDSYDLPQVYTLVSDEGGTGVVEGNELPFNPDTDFVGEGNVVVSFDGGTTKKICIEVTAGQVTPDPFFFLDLTDQPLNTLIESNAILVSGIDIPVSISITGGEYEINDSGVWSSVAGTVVNNDIVKVRQTSSATNFVTTDTVLTISSLSDTFSVKTVGTIVDIAFTKLNEVIPGTPSDSIRPAVSPDDTPEKNFLKYNQVTEEYTFSSYQYIDATARLGSGSAEQYIPNANYTPNNLQIKIAQINNSIDYPTSDIVLVGSGRLGDATGVGVINTSGEIILTTYDSGFSALYKGNNMSSSTFRLRKD